MARREKDVIGNAATESDAARLSYGRRSVLGRRLVRQVGPRVGGDYLSGPRSGAPLPR